MKKFLIGLLIVFVLLGVNVLTLAEEPKITIHYEDNAQFELINPEGGRVLVDVWDSGQLSTPATAKDILLTTHGHSDHTQFIMLKNFQGQQLHIKTGELAAEGVKINGIAAGHNEGDAFVPQDGTDYIFIIEMAGLRIVHFGDIGQNQLTPEQLKAIGEVDIALSQFANSYSNMNIDNKKGFNLMDQVKPKLIIPTHMDGDTAAYAVKKWKGFYAEKTLKIGKSNLEGPTKFVMLGTNGLLYGSAMKLAPHWN